MALTEINDVRDVFDIVRWDSPYLEDINKHIQNYESIFPYGTWFRGQEDAEWPLVPSVFRRNKAKELIYARNEPQLMLRFKLHQAKYRTELKTTFDWLSLMQHHAYPTRILDWSENILIALYFAVLDSADTQDKPGALFVLNAFKMNFLIESVGTHLHPDNFPCWMRAQLAEDTSFDSIRYQIMQERPGDLDSFDDNLKSLRNSSEKKEQAKKYFSKPLAIFPYHLHERMARQQSTFVLHGGTYVEESDFATPMLVEDLSNSSNDSRKFLKKFIIQPDKKDSIRSQLKMVGIHVGSIFPELEYQSQYLKDLWALKILPEKE